MRYSAPNTLAGAREAPELEAATIEELRRISEAMNNMEATIIILAPLAVEPAKVSEGMLAYADGANWDPGSGAGVYQYRGATWTLIG